MLEAVLVGIVLFVPLVWSLGVLSDLHRSALAVSAATRDAGDEAARASSAEEAGRNAERAVVEALTDHGLDASDAEIELSLGDIERGRVRVSIAFPVAIGRFPILGDVGGPSIWVRARHDAIVQPYASKP